MTFRTSLGDRDPDALPRLRHLLDAVGADEQRHRHHDLRLESLFAHQVAADEEVEELIGSPELDVGLQRDRVVALCKRIEVCSDRLRAFQRFWKSSRSRMRAMSPWPRGRDRDSEGVEPLEVNR
jgi:uncharacterized membrane protein YccC